MVSTQAIFTGIVIIICICRIIFEFIEGTKKLNYGKKMQAKILLYSVILLGVSFSQALAMTEKEPDSLGTYLFTTDEHYLECDIKEVKEEYVSLLSNETEMVYTATTGETITVGDQLLEVADEKGQTIYKNTGCKVIVVKE